MARVVVVISIPQYGMRVVPSQPGYECTSVLKRNPLMSSLKRAGYSLSTPASRESLHHCVWRHPLLASVLRAYHARFKLLIRGGGCFRLTLGPDPDC